MTEKPVAPRLRDWQSEAMRIEEIWPPYGVTLRCDDIEMRVVRESDAPDLVDVALSGVHDPGYMPFAIPWTETPRDELPAQTFRHIMSGPTRAMPDKCRLTFLVRVDGEAAGLQDIYAKNFPITRTAETGSWLGRRFHGRGIGTRMRRMVCAFGFEGLGAKRLESEAYSDNGPSLGVSRKVGYRDNGVTVDVRGGLPAELQHVVVTPETFIAGPPPDMEGVAPLRRFLGIPED